MALNATPSGRFSDVSWVDATGSTNSDLVERVRNGGDPKQPLVLFAEEQLAGRGRRDRTWTMPSGGGVLGSFFVPWTNPASIHLVPICMGVAAVNAATEVGRETELKWPNDLMSVAGQKIAGMLSDVVYGSSNDLIGVVVGFGCNISWPPEDDVDLPTATSLNRLGEGEVDRSHFASALVRNFDEELVHLQSRGPGATLERYRSRCATIGATVRIEQAGGAELVGMATDIDTEGQLLLLVDGTLRTLSVGDVVHLRPGTHGGE